ncbi:HU family DNA-binding protein [Oceanobacillus kimchii]|uniref:Transcriptional regulator n=1 Tax=Oceanobacillus kimchii TaxID=746691 RepID=A0ABQ5TH01_9BACI|nr:HU family DNA-binding protein [Oceanobacillus kimchii]GLO66153.1 transcriptional regulator [Oceanobacillus kimchii]
MNKGELVTQVAKATETTKKDAKVLVDTVFASIEQELAEGNDVSILGFGNWKVKDRAARTGNNPQTGEKIEIPATKTVKFTAGKKLKSLVKG